LGKYIKGLEFVIKNLNLFETQRHIVEAEINTTNALESMIIVQPFEIEEVDSVSDAASSRLRLIRERSSSNQVDNEPFFTAPSHLEVNLSPVELEDIEDENSVCDAVPQQERIMHEVLKQSELQHLLKLQLPWTSQTGEIKFSSSYNMISYKRRAYYHY
jgi:hypothetical protein